MVKAVAVTDHNTLDGYFQVRKLAAAYNDLLIIPGIEVTTRAGHLLGLWVDEPIPSFRSLAETIAAIHRAGGLAVLPHPFSMATRSVGQRALERHLAGCEPESRPDGIEVANPTLAGALTGERPRRLNRAGYALAETGGSDAHFLEAIGSGVTVFHSTADDSPGAALRHALVARSTWGELRRAPSLRQLGARRLLAQQMIGLSTTPRKVLGPPLSRLATRWLAGAGVR